MSLKIRPNCPQPEAPIRAADVLPAPAKAAGATPPGATTATVDTFDNWRKDVDRCNDRIDPQEQARIATEFAQLDRADMGEALHYLAEKEFPETYLACARFAAPSVSTSLADFQQTAETLANTTLGVIISEADRQTVIDAFSRVAPAEQGAALAYVGMMCFDDLYQACSDVASPQAAVIPQDLLAVVKDDDAFDYDYENPVVVDLFKHVAPADRSAGLEAVARWASAATYLSCAANCDASVPVSLDTFRQVFFGPTYDTGNSRPDADRGPQTFADLYRRLPAEDRASALDFLREYERGDLADFCTRPA